MDPPVERRRSRSRRGGNAPGSRIVSGIPSRRPSRDDLHGERRTSFIPNQHLHDSQTSQESWGPAVTASSGRRGGKVSSFIEVQHMSLGDEGSNSCSSTSQLSSRAGSQRGSYSNVSSLSNHLRGGNVSNKRQLKGRTRSDYSLGEDSDNSAYMIGNRGSGGRRHRGDQYSEDGSTSQSYDNLLDESSRRGSGGGGGGGGGWSLSKSVFSTLPDRLRRGRPDRGRDDDGSMYDGDDGSVYSLSSRGTNYSYGQARRVPSRSSSIASRMSQSSVGSGDDQSGRSLQSPRGERLNLPPPRGEGPYDYNSDDSMGSLLGEIDHEPDELNDGSAIGESLPETISVFSGSFLFDTKAVGAVADASEDDLRVSTISIGNFGLEDEMPIPMGGKGTEDPWWIEDLEKEGWFRYDTSTVRLHEPVPKLKSKEGSLHEDSDHGDGDMPSGTNLDEEDEEYEASQPIETSGGVDDTSTVGIEDGHVGDWEERLWSAAREHYGEYIGIDDMASSFAGSSLISGSNVSVDEQTVLEQEQQFELEYEREQKGVLAFRALLMKCIRVHAHSFHSKAERTSSKSNSDAYTSVVIPLGVDHYVPVPTARALYSEVIKMVDKEGSNNLSANTSIEKRADVVTTILTNDKVGIFRRYQVTTVKELTLTAMRDSKISRKRLNKGVKLFDAHAELEQYLYGEMFEADDGEDVNEQETVLETTEHEVRMRTEIVNSILAKCEEADMGVPQQIISHVLLSTISVLEEANVDMSREEGNHHQPIVHLYALRYIPVFLMRALMFGDVPALANGPTAINVTFEVLSSLLLKKSYVMKRYELQGPYDATLTHLSNFESAFGFHNNILRQERDDDEEYSAMHKLLVSTLISHLDSILINTSYQRKGDGGREREDSNAKKEEEEEEAGDETIITVHNYANIVATCSEIGRSLHHLGLCLGRRQRDRTATDIEIASPEDQSEKVDMEVKAYRNAFEAYKAAIYILNKAEENASHSANSRRISSNAELPQERESRTIGSKNELQQIRDARISIELHLADTLNCLGFCHDSKLGEFDRALPAYKESLSLYIKHVGRFHQTVSNALHNMGSIHCELGEWKQASSCFRQSLSILKREDKKTREERDQCNAEQGMHCPQILATLQCLGNALANLKEFEASAACFREVLASDLLAGFANSDSFVAEIESQMANVHYERATELSRTFNWRCHVMLFSEHKTRHGDRPPDAILAEEFETLREAQGCIQKAIETERRMCYKVSKKPSDDGIFFGNSPDPSPWLSECLGEELLSVSDDASLETLTTFAKDLLIAGRLDLRLRAYNSALSYIFEALIVNILLHSKTTDARMDKLRDFFRFQNVDKGLGSARLQVPEDASEIIRLLDDLEITADCTEVVTPLFLLGTICFRLKDLGRAKALFGKTLDLLNALPEDGDRVPENANMTAQVDIGHLLVRLGVIDHEVGDAELALSRFEEALSRFKPKSIVSEGSNEEEKGSLSKEIQIAINQGMALSRWYIGKIYQGQENKSHTALKYFKDAIQSLNENHVLRMDLGVDALPALIESYCSWDDIPIMSTAVVLSSSNERCGILLGSTNTFSLSCFEQAVGLREFVISSVGPAISSIDSEASIECFQLSAWDRSNMNCYRRMLKLIDKKATGEQIVESEEKNWKFTGLDDENESALTREDILFRMGNLQVKLGQLRPAIDSYREAEDLTVDKLGTRDHPIVMSISHNLGNAYKSVWLMSGTRKDGSGKEEAIACYQESVRISQAFYGKHHSSAAESLIGLGQLYMRNDELWLDILTEEDIRASEDNHLAYKFYREALSIRKREKGSNGAQAQQEVGSILCSLGVLRLRRYEHRRNEAGMLNESTGTLDEAVGLLAEGLKASKFGGQHTLHCRNCYFGLGKAHMARAIAYKDDEEKVYSELAKCFKAFETGLDIERSVASKMTSGSDCHSPNLFEACCLFYIGQACHRRCEHDKTKENLQSALRIFQSEGRKRLDQLKKAGDEMRDTDASGRIVKELEAIHLWAVKVLHHLGESHKETGSYSDSIECCLESMTIRRRQGQGINRLSNAATLTILAGSYFEAENYDRSVEYYARCLRIYLNRYGKESPEVAQILIYMGRSFSANELYVKAFQCFDKAMRIYDYGADELAPSTREKKSLLHRELASIVKHVDGDIFEALNHYRSSVSYLEEHIERKRAMQGHAERKREFDQQLMVHYQEMLSILRKVHAEERDRDRRADFREEICDVLHRLGNLHASRTEYDAALECFNEVLASKRTTDSDVLRVADLLFSKCPRLCVSRKDFIRDWSY